MKLKVIEGNKGKDATEADERKSLHAMRVFSQMKVVILFLGKHGVLPEAALYYKLAKEGTSPRIADDVVDSLLELDLVQRVMNTRLVLTEEGKSFVADVIAREGQPT